MLDDSTDPVTCELVDEKVLEWRERGIHVECLRRTNRQGYKAGAMKEVGGWGGLGRGSRGVAGLLLQLLLPQAQLSQVALRAARLRSMMCAGSSSPCISGTGFGSESRQFLPALSSWAALAPHPPAGHGPAGQAGLRVCGRI